MKSSRHLTDKEKNFLRFMILRSKIPINPNWEKNILVKDMEDGGMGSLSLYPGGIINDDRNFGEIVAEYEFQDADGILAIASLYLDDKGELYELDIWKGDSSKLIQLPDVE